jgi:hypothetical protein
MHTKKKEFKLIIIFIACWLLLGVTIISNIPSSFLTRQKRTSYPLATSNPHSHQQPLAEATDCLLPCHNNARRARCLELKYYHEEKAASS